MVRTTGTVLVHTPAPTTTKSKSSSKRKLPSFVTNPKVASKRKRRTRHRTVRQLTNTYFKRGMRRSKSRSKKRSYRGTLRKVSRARAQYYISRRKYRTARRSVARMRTTYERRTARINRLRTLNTRLQQRINTATRRYAERGNARQQNWRYYRDMQKVHRTPSLSRKRKKAVRKPVTRSRKRRGSSGRRIISKVKWKNPKYKPKRKR